MLLSSATPVPGAFGQGHVAEFVGVQQPRPGTPSREFWAEDEGVD